MGWLAASALPGAVSFLLVPYVIYTLAPPAIVETPEARLYAVSQLDRLGPASGQEKILTGVFVGVATLWGTQQLHGIDTVVAALTPDFRFAFGSVSAGSVVVP